MPPAPSEPPLDDDDSGRVRRPDPSPAARLGAWAGSLGPVGRGATAFAVYLLTTVGLYAWTVLPHLASRCVAVRAPDTRFYMWALRWMPYAMAHGEHPLRSSVIWAPTGSIWRSSRASPDPPSSSRP